MIRRGAKAGVVLLSVASAMLGAGCSRERIDWKSAEAADTQQAYDHFLQLHPDSALATQARARLAQLAEDKDWQRASAADTVDAYKQFLAQHPSGKWAEEARIRVESFALDSHPSPTATMTSNTGAAAQSAAGVATPGTLAEPVRSVLAAPPPGPPSKPAPIGPAASMPTAMKAAAAAPPPPAQSAPRAAAGVAPAMAPVARPAAAHASGAPASPSVAAKPESAAPNGFGIQLGAFSTQAAALGEWKRLQTTYDHELHGLSAHAVAVRAGAGTLFRLQSPVGEEARARGICAALSKHHQPCVVVLPQKH